MDDKDSIVMRRIPLDKCQGSDNDEKHMSKIALFQEIKFLTQFCHRNLVSYLGVFNLPDCIEIVQEYVPHPTLKSLCSQQAYINDESTLAYFSKQIIQGLEYLHHYDMMHGNLKAANIYVRPDSSIQLADFGRIYSKLDKQTVINSENFHWMAPELLQKGDYNIMNSFHDVWSLGCTVFELLTGEPPWHEEQSKIGLLMKITFSNGVLKYPADISAELLDFL